MAEGGSERKLKQRLWRLALCALSLGGTMWRSRAWRLRACIAQLLYPRCDELCALRVSRPSIVAIGGSYVEENDEGRAIRTRGLAVFGANCGHFDFRCYLLRQLLFILFQKKYAEILSMNRVRL